MRFEDTVVVSAPRDAVWRIVSDPLRLPELGSFVDEVELVSAGPWGVGSKYRERSGVGVLKGWSEWSVVRFEPPAVLTHEGRDSSAAATATWTIDEISDGITQVYQVADVELLPRFRLLGRVLEWLFAERLMAREAQSGLADLKALAEHEHAIQDRPSPSG